MIKMMMDLQLIQNIGMTKIWTFKNLNNIHSIKAMLSLEQDIVIYHQFLL